jgi:ketosteroid isomerase-like protein
MALGIALFAQGVPASSNKDTVENFVEAFNRHDIDAMLELTTDDLRWMSLANEQLSIEASNQRELREAMASYFASTPSARAEIRSITESGPFVHTVEEALWSSHGAKKNQCSMAVYEILEGNVHNVWYFPVHECP